MYNAITDVPGIKVGQYTDLESATGCTVILCEAGAVGGVDVRGSAPGTRETDLLRPMNMVQEAHAVLLSGGSAFGLDAAGGVMAYLEEQGVGFDTRVAKVPIVPAAILFDLGVGRADVRPGAKEGYQACLMAARGPMVEGSVGAGTGATVGKAMGLERATKGGVGTACRALGAERNEDKIIVGALVAVNAFGDVVDPNSGEILAGPRREDNLGFLNTVELLIEGKTLRPTERVLSNTTIGVVATNARLTKEQANKLAQMAHDGLARAIRPSHTMGDGDTIFALAMGKAGEPYRDLTALGTAAAEAVAEAVVRAITQAQSLAGIPASRDILAKAIP